jgi:DNA-binding response OmpR family regulator
MEKPMQHPKSLMVVDDDDGIREMLAKYFRNNGFSVTTAESLSQFEDKLALAPVDLIILDLVLGDGNGLEGCKNLRMKGDKTPIILLTASHEEIDRILGLEMGADDYMGKPFSPRELLARVNAVLRRTQSGEVEQHEPAPPVFEFDGFRMDCGAMSLTRGGEPVDLTSTEFELLGILVSRPRRVLSREFIFEELHGRVGDSSDRSIDVLMSRIRKKMTGVGGSEHMVKTIRNGGYQFTEKVNRVDGDAA